jgi:RNA polymerase sigma factor (sigma-70 family)
MTRVHGRSDFPTTRHSAIVALRSGDAAARSRSLDRLVMTYWRPVYTYLRLRWRRTAHEAEEITQEFFLRTIDRDVFSGYDERRSRFRTFVRVCLDRLVLDLDRRERTWKRGRGQSLSLDFAAAERELACVRSTDDPERLFEAEWLRGLVGTAIETLRVACVQKGKQVHFQVFERIHLGAGGGDRPSYAELAGELGISLADVTNRLSYARRELRAILLAALRECSATEQELHDEAARLLGVHL